MDAVENTSVGGRPADRGWLASLLLRRSSNVLPRFAHYYQMLTARPRPWRRQLRRKLAVTVSGAALLLALMGPVGGPASAETQAPEAVITVVNGEVADVDNGKCSLIEAIINARTNRAGQLRADCTAGNLSGPDTVSLPSNGSFTLTGIHNSQYGATGLPVINSAVTIAGNGSTIKRSTAAGTPNFRILAVDTSGNLTLQNVTIRSGNIADWDGGDGAGILNRGELSLQDSTVTYNNGHGGGGGITNSGTATISGSLIAYNGTEYYGGGIDNSGTMTIIASTIQGNWAWHAYGAGGILNTGTATLTNVTVTGNDGDYASGGIKNDEQMTLHNVTITGNDSDYATGGIKNTDTLVLNRTILSGNTNSYDTPTQSELMNSGTIIANKSNVFGFGGSSGLSGFTPDPTDIVPSVGLSAILGPLADNGGPTMTHALPSGSPALDLAPNAACTAAPVNGLDQRGEPRNANGTGGATANECDAGSFELQPATQLLPFLVSPATSGTVGGVAFTPADILKYDPTAGWSLYFDASDANVTKNLAAFEVLGNGSILMAFAANQSIAGVGTFAPQDVARFVPTAIGPNTAGSFQWELDGSTRGLTTTGEKIDALGDSGDGRIAISTAGAAAVPGPSGTIKAQDEDALGISRTSQMWSNYFNGTAVAGLAVEDVNALWVDPATGDLYVSIVGAFNLGGTAGNGKDIVRLTPNAAAPGGYTASLWWDGSAAGFPSNIDGLEILP